MKKTIVLMLLVLSLCLITGCKKKMVTVTLDLKGGTLPTEQLVYETPKKETFNFPTPEKPGYRFKGWFTRSGEQYDSSTKILEDVSVIAKWEEAIYSVTFKLNDDEIVYGINDYTKEALVKDFIQDYNVYSLLNVKKETFYSQATKPLFVDNGFLTNKEMLTKWEWLINYLKRDSAVYTKSEIEKGLTGNLNDINESYIFQELDGFLNDKKSATYSYTKPSADYSNETIKNNWLEMYTETHQETPTTYELGDEFKLPVPVKNGHYKFLGWLYKDQMITEVTPTTYGDLELIPVWEGEYYKVNYDLKGGKFNQYFELYKQTEEEIQLPTPEKKGEVFMGWFNEKGERLYSIPANQTGELNLAAKWGEGYCYIKYINYDGTLIEKIEIEKGQTAPVRTLGEFEGSKLEWFANDNVYDFNTIVKEDLNLYARWDFIETIIDEMFPEDLSQGLKVIEVYTHNNQQVEIFWSSSSHLVDVYGGEVRLPSTDITVEITGEFTMGNYTMYHTFKRELEPITFPSLKGKAVSFGYFANGLSSFDENDVIGTLDVLIHGFVRITNTFDVNLAEVKASMRSILSVREKGVRVLLCTGAYGSAAKVYSDAASTEQGRQTLARNLVEAVVNYGYDGIDLDWEYPGYETGRSTEVDRANFTLLIEEIYKQLKEVNPDYLLTAAIPGGTDGYRRYELKKLNKYFDYIQLMTYDLQTSNKVSHHTALMYNAYSTFYGSVSTTVNTFINEGVSPNKLVVGIAFYGRVYTLQKAPDSLDKIMGCTYVKESGSHTTYTNIYRYYISQAENDPNIHVLYDEVAKAPYIYVESSKTVISYDDPTSIKEKCKYALDNNLGGVMFWEYWEDTTGQLLQAIKEGMKK